MKSLSTKISSFQESIFATMSRLANQHKAINLSQGFPDFDCQSDLKELAISSIKEGWNQYAPFSGMEQARVQLARFYERFYGLKYDPDTQITVTCGATEAIYTGIQALVNPGDEVIVFEPFYDSYLASITMAGGTPVVVTLKAPHFTFTEEDLQRAFSEKTKLVLFNNPHNPTGRVFSREEMELLRKYVLKFDSYVLSDEVYECLVYDGLTHMPLSSLEGMKERTLVVSSMGKTFGVTGWKVGWLASSAEINRAVRMVHQFNTFSVATPFQMALAKALENLEEIVPQFKKEYQAKRDYFFKGLEDLGFRPIHPKGSYFIMCPIDHLTSQSSIDYCQELILKRKVAAIPASPFYLHSREGDHLIRFCFAKKEETLKSALLNLSM